MLSWIQQKPFFRERVFPARDGGGENFHVPFDMREDMLPAEDADFPGRNQPVRVQIGEERFVRQKGRHFRELIHAGKKTMFRTAVAKKSAVKRKRKDSLFLYSSGRSGILCRVLLFGSVFVGRAIAAERTD